MHQRTREGAKSQTQAQQSSLVYARRIQTGKHSCRISDCVSYSGNVYKGLPKITTALARTGDLHAQKKQAEAD